MVRFVGRVTATLIALLFFALVGVQFFRVINQNVVLAHELHQTNSDVATLERLRDQKTREMRRLQDADGAVPEIHERLRLVKSNEELIFVSPAPAPSPAN